MAGYSGRQSGDAGQGLGGHLADAGQGLIRLFGGAELDGDGAGVGHAGRVAVLADLEGRGGAIQVSLDALLQLPVPIEAFRRRGKGEAGHGAGAPGAAT
ncbi:MULTISPECIES: hypothetical protein [Roseomonadaceae]|uniref:Uncharacterized protein n=1 Tax=Falsiroseomonas oleicola TaxID=2801474 RepID=A0ABS6H7P7_9PROT|nr:hypothetical protein [Roseomonas oleicola]MBU8543973.1 hypothetical protein [Roseomonas oleicola]